MQFFWIDRDFSTHGVMKKGEKKTKFETVRVTFFLDIFWTTAWAGFNKIKIDMINIFFNYLCNFIQLKLYVVM